MAKLIARAHQKYQITSLEIFTASFVVCSVLTYTLNLKRPQNVQYPIILYDGEPVAPQPDVLDDPREERAILSTHAATAHTPPTKPPLPQEVHPKILGESLGLSAREIPLFGVFGLLFPACIIGGLHCLAWNSPFPTTQEKLAWRICSCSSAGIPFLGCLGHFYNYKYANDDNEPSVMDQFILALQVALGFLYCIARLTLVVLTLTSLRALPADVYETVDWPTYFPHFTN